MRDNLLQAHSKHSKGLHVRLSADIAGRMFEKQDIIAYPLEMSEYARGYYNCLAARDDADVLM